MRRKNRINALERAEENLMNLTPLIDVVFVILIAFILIAPLLEVDQVDLARSFSTKDTVPSEKGLVKIYVQRDNSIWLGNERVSLSQLQVRLQQAKRQFPNQIPQLFHDSQGYFGTYQSIKNTVENTGFAQLDVILKTN